MEHASALFSGHLGLLLQFNRFLPDGYKIERCRPLTDYRPCFTSTRSRPSRPRRSPPPSSTASSALRRPPADAPGDRARSELHGVGGDGHAADAAAARARARGAPRRRRAAAPRRARPAQGDRAVLPGVDGAVRPHAHHRPHDQGPPRVAARPVPADGAGAAAAAAAAAGAGEVARAGEAAAPRRRPGICRQLRLLPALVNRPIVAKACRPTRTRPPTATSRPTARRAAYRTRQ